MRNLCIILAIVVFALCVGAGYFVGVKVGGPFAATMVSYDSNVITAACTGVGAVIGLLSACGFIISAVLAGRVRRLERRVRKLGRSKGEE